jgi:hypothetical protein
MKKFTFEKTLRFDFELNDDGNTKVSIWKITNEEGLISKNLHDKHSIIVGDHFSVEWNILVDAEAIERIIAELKDE